MPAKWISEHRLRKGRHCFVFDDGHKAHGTLVYARDKDVDLLKLAMTVDGLRGLLASMDLGLKPHIVVQTCGILTLYWKGQYGGKEALHRWGGRNVLQVMTDVALALTPSVLDVRHEIDMGEEQRAVLFLEELDLGTLHYVEHQQCHWKWKSEKEAAE